MMIIAFRELPHDNDLPQGYKLVPVPEEGFRVVKEMVLLGKHGINDLYIRHINSEYEREEILIISYTEYELDKEARDKIYLGAIKFLKELEGQQ